MYVYINIIQKRCNMLYDTYTQSDIIYHIERSSMRRKIVLVIALISSLALSGCSVSFGQKKQTEAEKQKEQYQQEVSQLQNETFYVYSNNSFAPVAAGTQVFGYDDKIATHASTKRLLLFTEADEKSIPTLYKGDKLVYYAKTDIPDTFTLERFTDLGYTVGVNGFKKGENAAKFTLKMASSSILAGTDAQQCYSSSYADKKAKKGSTLTYVKTDTELIADKISGTTITDAMVSPSGVILGLTKDKSYTLDLYQGTTYIGHTIKCDTRALQGFEVYTTQDYTMTHDGYMVINIPDNFHSGYYYVQGSGLFKYIAGAKGSENQQKYDIPNVTAQDGDYYTADSTPGASDSGASASVSVPDTYTWTYFTNLDRDYQTLEIHIPYSTSLKKDQTTGVPEAKILGPNGETYRLNDNGEELAYTVDDPAQGNWDIEITGMDNRTFDTNVCAKGQGNGKNPSGAATSASTEISAITDKSADASTEVSR